MASGPETRLQKRIQDRVKEVFPSAYLFKVHGGPYQKRGLPDLMGCINGRLIGIEVKVPGKEKNVTKLQQNQINQINAAGGYAFVSTDPEQAVQILEEEFIR